MIEWRFTIVKCHKPAEGDIRPDHRSASAAEVHRTYIMSSRSRAMTMAMRADLAPEPGSSDFEEISLLDIARVLYRRRIALAIALVLSLVAGGALTVFTQPQFEAEAQVIPLEHAPIIKSWLGSRQAAEFAVAAAGGALNEILFPDDWDAAAGTWSGTPRTPAEVATLLVEEHTELTGGTTTGANANPVLRLTVTLPDAQVAAAVAQAYLDSLATLRPELENITRSDLFDQYYDGTNAQEAQARAERAAREKTYWIVFDSPTVPDEPVRPRPVLNMALATVLGVMLGVFAAFGLEWLSKYRAELTR